MSKRFGRNQRRRARERIASLETQSSRLTQNLLASSRTVSELQDEIDAAKRIAGEHCVAFEPHTKKMHVTEADYYMLMEFPHFDLRFLPDPTRLQEPLHIAQVPLPVMMAMADPEWRTLARHVVVQFQGKRYGYAVDMRAFLGEKEPHNYLRVVGGLIAKMIYLELTKPVEPCRPAHPRDFIQLSNRI